MINLLKYNNEDIPKRLNEFNTYMITIKAASDNTVDNYSRDLMTFFKFMKIYRGLEDVDAPFETISVKDVDDDFIKSIKLQDLYSFISYLQTDRNNKISSRKRRVASLKSFFNYLYRKLKVIDEDPTMELETPKASKRNPIYLSEQESRKLLDTVCGRNEERDYCIIIFFLNCGLRLSELCSLDLSKIKGNIVTVVGKGNKERTVYLNKMCMSALGNYIPVRAEMLEKVSKKNHDALFLSEQKKRIDKRTVEKIVEKYIEKAGYSGKHYSPHKLRHTAATLLYQNGVDILRLKELLGHENVSTTQIYTHVDNAQLKEAVELNPLNN